MNTYPKRKMLFITQFAILTAIEAIFCFTPLGSLPAIGPIVATLAMIPVIITAILLGPKVGTIMGAVSGLFSFIVWTFMPPQPIAFVFTPFYSLGDFHGNFGSILICFIPRILVGTVTGVVYKMLSKILHRKDVLGMIISSILGSLTNTFGVMFGIWLFFGDEFSAVAGAQVEGNPIAGFTIAAIVGYTILTSGIPEAVVSAIACPAVSKPVKKLLSKKQI